MILKYILTTCWEQILRFPPCRLTALVPRILRGKFPFLIWHVTKWSRIRGLIKLQLWIIRCPIPSTMKYLALISGGKDSCYNLVHCAHNGHELVAAASLGPGPGKGPAYTQSGLLAKFTAS